MTRHLTESLRRGIAPYGAAENPVEGLDGDTFTDTSRPGRRRG